MTYNVPKFVKEINELIEERNSLSSKRQDCITRLKKGETWFKKSSTPWEGISTLLEIVEDIKGIEERASLVESAITSKLELNLIPLVIKTEKFNFSDFEGVEGVTVSPEELMSIKMLKGFVREVELCDKEVLEELKK